MSDAINPFLTEVPQPLLVVEDSDFDFETLIRSLNKLSYHSQIYRVEDGDEALDFLFHQGEYTDETQAPRPALILLDLNLPGTDGREVIAQLKQNSSLKQIPIIVFTTSSNPQDVEFCYQHGANSYVLKPIDTKSFADSVKGLLAYWLETVILPNSIDLFQK
ncbi:MAG: response regulator [Symploca sp. SIO1A3]|nr:response regulator [Symploca sp. SIO1A3]